MISVVGLGTAEIPESEPAEPVVVVVDIVPSMGTDIYDVNLLLPAELPPEDVEITTQDSDTVTLTVTRPDGYAGTPGLTVYLLCIVDTDIDTSWVDASAFLADGWTGNVELRKVNSIVYLRFGLTAAASIDGLPRDATVPLLNGLDTAYEVNAFYDGQVGYGLDEADQFMAITHSGGDSYVVYGPNATGTWADGASFLSGIVSWVAGT